MLDSSPFALLAFCFLARGPFPTCFSLCMQQVSLHMVLSRWRICFQAPKSCGWALASLLRARCCSLPRARLASRHFTFARPWHSQSYESSCSHRSSTLALRPCVGFEPFVPVCGWARTSLQVRFPFLDIVLWLCLYTGPLVRALAHFRLHLAIFDVMTHRYFRLLLTGTLSVRWERFEPFVPVCGRARTFLQCVFHSSDIVLRHCLYTDPLAVHLQFMRRLLLLM